jgi:hypothetical protein
MAGPTFLKWQLATEVAPAAAGRHLPTDELANNFATWQGQLETLDRIFALTAGLDNGSTAA